MALARVSACMRAPSKAQQPRAPSTALHVHEAPAKAAGAGAGDALQEPGKKQQQQQQRHGSTSSALPPLANGDVSHSGQGKVGGGDSVSIPVQDVPEGASSSEGNPLHWQAAEGSGVVSIAAVGLTCAVLRVAAPGGSSSAATPADMQQPPGAPLAGAPSQAGSGMQPRSTVPAEEADLRVSMEWASDSSDAAAWQGSHSGAPVQGLRVEGNATKLRCHLNAKPALPAGVLRTLEDMAGAHPCNV